MFHPGVLYKKQLIVCVGSIRGSKPLKTEKQKAESLFYCLKN